MKRTSVVLKEERINDFGRYIISKRDLLHIHIIKGDRTIAESNPWYLRDYLDKLRDRVFNVERLDESWIKLTNGDINV